MTRSSIVCATALTFLLHAAWVADAEQIVVDTDSNTIDFGGNQQAADLPGPDGVISLHEAITAANNTPGEDTITFNSSAVFGIDILDPLPPLEDTSGGTTLSGNPGLNGTRLENSSPQVGNGTTALRVLSASNIIEGLTIEGFDTGIRLEGPGAIGNAVRRCDIDDDPVMAASSSNGIQLSGGASGNIIGGLNRGEQGSTVDYRNSIDGMIGVGILIEGAGTSFNHLFGNTVEGRSRTDFGIGIYGGASGNLIGGEGAAANQIYGCDQCGISIFASDDNLILGNFIGATLRGNISGICIQSSGGVVIGSAMDGGNTVRDNIGTGIRLSSFGGRIEGNDVSENGANGIEVFSSGSFVIGGTEAGAGNTFKQNGGNGILLDFNTIDVGIIGNSIGGQSDGDGNGLNGIELRGGSNSNSIGGLDAASGNDIRFNGMHGVLIGSDCHLNYISQNEIAQNMGKNIMLAAGANQGIQAPVVTNTLPLGGTAMFGSTVEVYQAHPDDLTGSSTLIVTIPVIGGVFISSLGAAQLGDAVVLLARDASGNSSEFTPECLIEDCENPDPPDPPDPPEFGNPLTALIALFLSCEGDNKTTSPETASADGAIFFIGLPALLSALGRRRRGP